MKLFELLPILNRIAPLETAEDWDNVGLLVGDSQREVDRVMTCLTLTATTLREAIDAKANLVVCHHPIPFKPMARITSDTSAGSLLLQAIEARIAIYSPHTAWDNAARGINQQLADILLLQSVRPLKNFPVVTAAEDESGVGRCGYLPGGENSISSIMRTLEVSIPGVKPRYTHSSEYRIKKIGIVCGSGGSMLGLVASRGCDAMLTGEATYHQCLEAESKGIAMLMIGHHASEFFAMQSFANLVLEQVKGVEVIASQKESSSF